MASNYSCKPLYISLSPEKRRGVDFDFDVIWLASQVGKDKLDIIQDPKEDSSNKALSGFLRTSRSGSVSLNQYWTSCHCQGDYPECIQMSVDFFRNIVDLK